MALGSDRCSCPDSDSCPENAISADLIDDVVIGSERPRAWLEREINVQAAMAGTGKRQMSVLTSTKNTAEISVLQRCGRWQHRMPVLRSASNSLPGAASCSFSPLVRYRRRLSLQALVASHVLFDRTPTSPGKLCRHASTSDRSLFGTTLF